MNQASLIGNLGQDPYVRYGEDGICRASFSLAVNGYSTKEKARYTDWIDIRLKGTIAEIAGNNLKKGSMVSINGELKTYMREKDGLRYKVMYVLVSSAVGGKIKFLNLRKASQGEKA